MKANELRIGNLTNFGKVIEINTVSFYVRDSEGIEVKSSYADIKPLRLTEYWLLKFGFKRHHADYSNEIVFIKNVPNSTEFEWGVYPDELGSGIQIKNRVLLKYVHQLQNLYFALTNEELTIKL